MPGCRNDELFSPDHKRADFSVVAHVGILISTLLVLAACHPTPTPERSYEQVQNTFLRGDLLRSQEEGARGYEHFAHSDPKLALRFRVIEAESLIWRGMGPQALKVLEGISPPDDRSLAISICTLQGLCHSRMHQFRDADRYLQNAERSCAAQTESSCGAVFRARGVLAIEQGKTEQAKMYFGQSLDFARAHRDQFLESTALQNLGAVYLQQGHFEDAADWSNSALRLSTKLGARRIAQAAVGN